MSKRTSIYSLVSYITILILAFSCIGCDENQDFEYGIFSVVNENTIEMDGEINSNSLSNFNRLIDDHQGINSINIKEVPGSSDDEINLQLSRLVHQNDISTHLTDNGLIASGGVDFFLAGTTRTSGINTQIGVHSWSDGTNEATDFPVGDSNHLPYIDYYVSIGFNQQDAEEFYYFTINAAAASSIHWMSKEEIMEFKLLTQ